MEPRGRGRGYGRARGQPGAPPQQPQPRPGPQQPPPGQGPPRGAQPASPWVRMPQSAWPRPQVGMAPPAQPQPPPEQIAGRGRRQAESEGAIPRRVTGQGEGAENTGSSSVRGRVVNRREILITRPASVEGSKKGTSGSPITLLSNFLPLLKKPNWCLYQYRVDMNPDIDHTGKRKFLVRTGAKDLFQSGYLFDGTVLYSPQRIANDTTEVFVQDENVNVRITIRLVGDVAWGDAHYVQLFNIIIRKCLTLMGLKLIGRNYFMPDAKVVIPDHKIQLWPGYFTSIRQHEKEILLNVDLQFKFMRTDNVYDLLLECQGPSARKDFQSKIIGSVVLTYYNNRTYKVDDVEFDKTPNDTFQLADGSQITYKQYYEKKYGVSIRIRDQPLLLSRSKQREIRVGMPETVYLVPELCQLTGLTDKQRDNFNLMKTLATHTRIGVESRIQKLLDFSRKIQNKPEVLQEIKRWDLDIAKQLIEFQGRVLPNESILGGRENKYPAGHQADWTRELRSKPMLINVEMRRLAVICPSKFANSTRDFLQILSKTASGMHWSLGNHKLFEMPDDRTGTYVEHIEKVVSNAQPTLVLTVVPNNSQDKFSAIKKKCYVDKGCPSQVIVARNLNSKGVMSIATKVAIQMNCKIGGAPWSVAIPLSNLMIVGYDVCRDTANKRKSFAAMVASLDKLMTRYFSIVSEHKMEEELSDNFATFMVTACQKFKEVNGTYPEKILIYRDGVGAGQLPYVANHEVDSIKNTLKQQIYKDGNLKLAFVVVSKRINTRIFTAKDNPPPGTVVDDVITLPERYDFYIVSQCVRQGTVSPTSYNVIEDTLGLGPDKMQMLTYKLTHLYYNWSGTVRVPAPCQYAHKLAFLVSQNLHRPAHPDLQTLLYYL